MGYSNLLAEDKKLVTYRPRLNKITGSVTATVLLQQIIFHADNVGNRPFYKFRTPCEHKLYREGDSWTEELGFSPAEFDTARSKIATRIMKGDSKTEALKGETANHLVIYWTDASRITWYMLNVDLLNKILEKLYADSRNSNYQESGESPNSESQDSGNIRKLEKEDLPLPEIPPETSTEDTEKTDSAFPEKRKERTDENPSVDDPDGRDRRGTMLGLDGGQSAKTGGITDAFPDGRSDGADIGKADPLRFDLARHSAAVQAKGGDFAVPPSAGGSFALADRLITAACARLGRSEPEGKKRDNAVAFFEKALKAERLQQGDAATLVQAVRDWLDPEGEYAFFLPQYDLNPRHELALRHFGIMLSKAKKQADSVPDRRARYDTPAVRASQAAFEERKKAKPPPVMGDSAWENAKRELALQMTKPTFDTWVRDTYGLGQEDGVYIVIVPNALARDWLDNRLKTAAQRTLVGILSESVEVVFKVEI